MKAGDGKGAVRGAAIAWWFAPAFFLAIAIFFSSQLLEMRSREGGDGEGGGARLSLKFEISRRPFLSFGFRNFLADLVWLEAVQVSGSRKMTPGDYDRLSIFLQTVINFDPRFKVPYLLGGLILGESWGHVPEAVRILEKGMENHPSDWRFPFYLGFTQYFSLGDPQEAGITMEAASRIPGSPPYLPLLASRMLVEGRNPETALALLSGMVSQETDPAREKVLRKRILDVTAERDIQMLERAVAEYRRRTESAPANLADLVREGFVRTIPPEPHGGRYLLSPDGTVRSSEMRDRLRVFRSR